MNLDIDLIHRGEYQPRVEFGQTELEELAETIRDKGLIQPVVVRDDQHGGYELIAGERRWRASQLAGLSSIPAIIRNLSDREAAEVSLIENNQRANLRPMEEARAILRLIREFNLKQWEAAVTLGKSREYVANMVRLEGLSSEVQRLLDEENAFTLGHAKVLISLNPQQQLTLAKRVMREGLSVRAIERLVNQQAKPKQQPQQDQDLKYLEAALTEQLGNRVEISVDKTGQGRMVIHFHSNDEFEGICERCGLSVMA